MLVLLVTGQKALYGTVAGVEIGVTDTATLTVGSGTSATQLNLWQQNMVAVKADRGRFLIPCFLLTGDSPS